MKLKISRKKKKRMEIDTKVLNKSADKYADKADNTGRFRWLPSQAV